MDVLVVEDDKLTLKLLQRTLEKWNYSVVAFSNGEDAWSCLQQKERPRLALLDWMMPGIDGIELCKRLSAEDRNDFVYRIMLTGRTEKDSLVTALEAGADEYITKPFNPTELRLRLKNGTRIIESSEHLSKLNRELESKVDQRTEELKEALDIANRASQMKSLFLANMSHEIRTPLNGILSYVELLLMSELDEEQRIDMETIQTSAHNLRTIVNDVLDFSKIEAGKMLLDLTEFPLYNAVDEVSRLLQVKFDEKDITFVTDYSFADGLTVRADRVRLQQMLTNLLGNASKFTRKGGGVIFRVETSAISSKAINLTFHVCDSGKGIASDKQDDIFESFKQEDAGVSRRHGGTGLGLAITARLAEAMSGSIEVESIQGRGSRFSLSVPVERCKVAEKQVSPESAARKPVSAPEGNQLRVLLAEDNDLNRNAMVRLLQLQGYSVTEADSGHRVLSALEESEFDIVLMDVQMPGMSGDQATQSIRGGTKSFASVPIIMLTAHAMQEHRDEYLRIGADEVVTKPIEYGELFSTIEKVVRR